MAFTLLATACAFVGPATTVQWRTTASTRACLRSQPVVVAMTLQEPLPPPPPPPPSLPSPTTSPTTAAATEAAETPTEPDEPDELDELRFGGTARLFGRPALERLQRARVLVVGSGQYHVEATL